MNWYWKEDQKRSINDFLEKINNGTCGEEGYIGCVRTGELCFDLIVREHDPETYKLDADLYVSGVDSKYGISPTGKQYDFFSDVGFSLNAEDFADMDYMKFIEVIQD